MYDRLKDFPVYQTRKSQVSATHYNHVEVAFKHLKKNELRYLIPGLRHLAIILQHDAWIIVDIVLNEAPIAAWINFETQNRSSLHEPVDCQINFYHIHAHMIMNRTLDAMEMILGEELAEELPDDKADVMPFTKDKTNE